MRFFKTMLLLAWVVNPALAQDKEFVGKYSGDAEQLSALGRDLWADIELVALGYAEDTRGPAEKVRRARQACLFLEAATEIDSECDIAWRDLTMLYMTDGINDPGRSTMRLYEYSTRNVRDTQPIRDWLEYRLRNLPDSRTREKFLKDNMGALTSYPSLRSRALMHLGNFALERGENDAAQSYFENAFNTWQSNAQALASFVGQMDVQAEEDSLVEIPEEEATREKREARRNRELYGIFRWRVGLQVNPFDLEAALKLIEKLDELGQHELAQKYYPHAYKLLEVQEDVETATELKKQLRVKQLISAFSGGIYDRCIPIGGEALRDDPESFVANALTGRAWAKVGMTGEAERSLRRAAKHLNTQSTAPLGMAKPGRFYCFIDPQPTEAVKYAQQEAQADPNDSVAQATYVYALALNEEVERAAELLTTIDPNEVVAALTWAKISAAQNDPMEALRRLMDLRRPEHGILGGEVETLSEELRERVSDDRSIMDDLPRRDWLLVRPRMNPLGNQFQSTFDDAELAVIEAPRRTIHCTLSLVKKTDVFSYGQPMVAELLLANKSETEVPLGPGTVVDPHVLIVAEVTPVAGIGGDKGSDQNPRSAETKVFPIAYRYLLQRPSLPRGHSNKATELLNIGPLRDILERHPQQAYRIVFHSYVDPVADGAGGFSGRIGAIQPSDVTIVRKAFVPTEEQMWFHFNVMQSGTPDERVRAAHLMGGLLREAELARQGLIRYNIRRIDEDSIRKLVAENLKHEDFRVRAWSAYAFRGLLAAAESVEAQGVVQLLSDEHWFVRFMAAQALEPTADMSEYVRYAQAVEQSEVIKRQVEFIQGQPWEVIEMPVEIDEPNEVPEEEEEEWGVDDLL